MFLTFRSVQQIAALPFVCGPEEPLVLLITSRERKRWIVPKGWPVGKLAPSEAAAKEAEEEAGLIGQVALDPLGFFHYEKRMSQGYAVPCRVSVYPLLVTEQRADWKERGERSLLWVPLSEAIGKVDDIGLAKLLKKLKKSECRALRKLSDSWSEAALVDVPQRIAG